MDQKGGIYAGLYCLTLTLNKNTLQVQLFPQAECSQSTASTGSIWGSRIWTQYPKIMLFQHVQSVEKLNTMKRRLKTYWKRGRINPDKLEAVSDDEPEDPMPDVLDIINLPQNTNSEPTPQPSIWDSPLPASAKQTERSSVFTRTKWPKILNP